MKQKGDTTKKSGGDTRGNAHVALLRGINVGGKNTLSMKSLASLFVDAGCNDVQTYIQSGNVVFTASKVVAGQVAETISRGIEEGFGILVPVVTRSLRELETVVANNPFLLAGAGETIQHVGFLATVPEKNQVANLDPKRSPPDEFTILNREIYLCLPNGIGRSKLTNVYFDTKLANTVTIRNWRTVLKLLEICKSRP